MSSSTSATASKHWHVAAWPPLAWRETAIKLVALGRGILAFVEAAQEGPA